MKTLRKYDRKVPAENPSDLAKSLKNNDSDAGLMKIKELALSDSLTSVILVLHEIITLKGQLSLELQAIRDDRKAQQRDFRELVGELQEALTKIQANFRIEAQLLNLITKDNDNAGENEQKGRGTRTQAQACRVLPLRK
jgi:hypothetical protein